MRFVKQEVSVFDALGRASMITLEVAKIADLVVILACERRDNLAPAIKSALELQKREVSSKVMVAALNGF
jgi:hypothetical protein